MIEPPTVGFRAAVRPFSAVRELPAQWIMATALLCGFLAYVCIVATRGSGHVAAIWLPNAVLVAILARRADDPVTAWVIPAFPAYLIAGLMAGDGAVLAAGVALAHLTEVSLCVLVLRHTGCAQPDLASLPDLTRFSLVGGLLAPASSALAATLFLPPANLVLTIGTFARWTLTDGLAMTLVAPTLWIIHAAWIARARRSAATLRQWALIVNLGGLLTMSVFSQDGLPWLFLLVPAVFVHTFRLGLLGTACSIITIGIIALIATAAGTGPIHFVDSGLAIQLFTLQLFLVTTFGTGVTLAVMLEDRRRAIAELTDARDLHQSMLGNMHETVFRTDSDGRWEFLNPAWEKLTGYSVAESLGCNATQLLPPHERETWIDLYRSLYTGETDDIAVTQHLVQTNGDVRTVEVTARALRNPQGRLIGTVGNIRDVTVRKALEETLIRARRSAEDAAVTKSAFLANMSHEIRTPMNGVLGFAELLLHRQPDPESRRFAQMIVDSGREMMSLLNDILDLSKIEAGQMTIISEPIDLGHLLRRCIRLMSANAQAKGLALTLELDADLPPLIMGDGQHIRQIALNLIGNALKFTDHGHVTVRAHALHAHAPGKQLQLEIDDSGIGISPEQCKLIFEPFAQGDSSTARRYGGSGLGLTICRQLAEGMKGTLTFDSEAGQGSIFRFTMPLTEPQAGRRKIRAKPLRPSPTPVAIAGRPLHILLAEDHDINQQLVTAILTRDGHRLTIANDGAEAIELVDAAAATSSMFDLVLMDIQMPKIDGFTATRAIRSRGHAPADLPIIALTANALPDQIAACLKAGMQAHLAKPISRQALNAALLKWGHAEAAVAALSAEVDDSAFSIDPSLRELYVVRRADVLAQVGRMIADASYDDDAAKALAAELHKLAGTAAMFGEPEVGTLAATLERQLLEWDAEQREHRVAAAAAHFQQATARSA